MVNPLTNWNWETLGVCCSVLRMTEADPLESRGCGAAVGTCVESFSYLAGVLKGMGVPFLKKK